jgi:hypothetical protein
MERSGVKGAGYFAWRQSSPKNPNRSDVFVKGPNGDVRRVNRAGTRGALGGISGDTLVYQEFTAGDSLGYHPKGRSTIRFYNLRTGARSTPRHLDTGRWPYLPSLSGDWLMFGRVARGHGPRALVLHNLRTNRERVIRRVDHNDYLQPGQINGNYAVWVLWKPYPPRDFVSTVAVYEIDSRMSQGFHGSRPYQWAPSVARDGTVYLENSGYGCGSHVHIIRFTKAPGDPYYDDGTTVLRFPKGVDLSATYATGVDGFREVLHDRFRCSRTAADDVYSFGDSYRLNVTKDGFGSGEVSSEPRGILCGPDCEFEFSGGTLVTLHAEPSAGSSFGGWSGDCAGTDDCTIKMNEAKSVTATFDIGP